MMQLRRAVILLVGSAAWLTLSIAIPIWRAGPNADAPAFLPSRSRAGHDLLSIANIDKRAITASSDDEADAMAKRGAQRGEWAVPMHSYSPLEFGSTKQHVKLPSSQTHKKWTLFKGGKSSSATFKDSNQERQLPEHPPANDGPYRLGYYLHGKDWKPEQVHHSAQRPVIQSHTETIIASSPPRRGDDSPSKDTPLYKPDGIIKERGIKIVDGNPAQSEIQKKKKKVQFRPDSELVTILGAPNEVPHKKESKPDVKSETKTGEKKKTTLNKLFSWGKKSSSKKADQAGADVASAMSSNAGKTKGSAISEIRVASPNTGHQTSSSQAQSSIRVDMPAHKNSQSAPAIKKKGWNPFRSSKESSSIQKTESFKAKEYMKAHQGEVSLKSAPYTTKIEKSPEEEAQIKARMERINAEMATKKDEAAKGKKMPDIPKPRIYKSPHAIHDIVMKEESSSLNGDTSPKGRHDSKQHSQNHNEPASQSKSRSEITKVKLPAGMTAEEYLEKMSSRTDPLPKTSVKNVPATLKPMKKEEETSPWSAERNNKKKNPLGNDILDPEYKAFREKWMSKSWAEGKAAKEGTTVEKLVKKYNWKLKDDNGIGPDAPYAAEAEAVEHVSHSKSVEKDEASPKGADINSNGGPDWMKSQWKEELETGAKQKKAKWPWSTLKSKSKESKPASNKSIRDCLKGWNGLLPAMC